MRSFALLLKVTRLQKWQCPMEKNMPTWILASIALSGVHTFIYLHSHISRATVNSYKGRETYGIVISLQIPFKARRISLR